MTTERLSTGRALFILGVMGAFWAAEVAVGLHPMAGAITTVVLLLLGAGQLVFFLIYSMHLGEETRAFRRMVAAPLVIACLYGVILIAESVWRHAQ